MTFPALELKFSNIVRNSTVTSFRVMLYRLDDGGLNLAGEQIYLRTIIANRNVNAPAGVTKAQVLNFAKNKLDEWAAEQGYNLTPDRLVCAL